MKITKWLPVTVLFVLLAVFYGGAAADTTHTVQSGDTLSAIGRRFGPSVQAIAAANNIVNPNLIYVGQVLIIPGVPDSGGGQDQPVPAPIPSSGTYVVQRGDTLFRIALNHGVTLQALGQANGLTNLNVIFAGQTLIIPGSPPAVPPTPSPLPPPGSTPEPPAVPTPTPQPTAVPQPSGVNLLPNPSFEGGHYNLNGIPELQVPNGWQLDYDEGSAPGTGVQLLRPETRVLPRWNLPAFEQPLYIWNGDWTIKAFKGHAPISFRLFTDLHLEPGVYRFTASFFPDLVIGYTSDGHKIWASQSLAGEAAFIHNSVGGWSAAYVGVKNTMVREFTVTSAGTNRIGVALRTRYAIPNNGFFTDDWSLYRLSN